MARTQNVYSVLHAFGARSKETKQEVWITRGSEGVIETHLTPARIAEHVAAGNLAVAEMPVDEAGDTAEA